MTLYCITYDIANPRRLSRLHRGLKRFAMPVQYSVFFAELTPAGLRDVSTLIERNIDPTKDDVRIYALPRSGWARVMGRPLLPTGISYTALPLEFRRGKEPSQEVTSQERDLRRDDPEQTIQAPRRSAVQMSRTQREEARRIQSRIQTGDRKGLLLI